MAGTKRRWTVAAVQMTSTADRDGNLAQAEKLFRRAVASGADLVAFPENFTYLHSGGGKNPFAVDLRGDMLARLRGWARESGCFLLAGSLPERIPGQPRVFNTSVLISPGGRMVARYRKIHLFDCEIPGRVSLKESSTVAPGNRAVVAATSLGKLGLSVCYDLRFPELYRRLVGKGAQVIFVPSAFTAYTGRSHWMPLLRARAIENQCWVVAPAQVGRHSRRRESYGHTVILDPWGDVAALKRRGKGFVCAEIDLERLRKIRNSLPSLKHLGSHVFDSRLR